jgi:hypothetical protein
MSLKEVLQGDTKVRAIKIKVLVNQGEKSIVGDGSGLAICCAPNMAFRKMLEGQCYTILKPLKLDQNTIIPNEKLKPFQIDNFPLTPKKSELLKLQTLLKDNFEDKDRPVDKHTSKLTTFQDIANFPPKTEIRTITAKILNISKDIAGTYGTYNIAKLKDKNSDKMDINIYNQKIKAKMQVGDIFELRHLKVTEYVKDGESSRRLVTTARSSGSKPNSEIETLFKDVPLGDKREEGKVVAIHDIFSYFSCSKCWKKTDEEDTICSCGNSYEIHVKDFHFQMYIETTQAEIIEVIHTFRRQTKLVVDTLVPEDIQTVLENTFFKKMFTFEWNIITDEEELRMINITETDGKQTK